MNFQTDTHTALQTRHRLYVAVPLFVVLAWFGGIRGGYTASVSPESPDIVTQSGMVAGRSRIQVVSGDLTMSGWNGVFAYEAPQSGIVTVAALTTPVVISRGEDRWLVPVGMQLSVDPSRTDSNQSDWISSRRPRPLPAYYLRERLPEAEHMLQQAVLPVHPELPVVLSPLAGNMLRFGPAQERATVLDIALRLARLDRAFAENDRQRADDLLLESRTQEALSRAGADALWDTLAAASQSGRDALVLPFLLHDADAVLIARFHPLLRARAWAYPLSGSGQSALLGQMLLPLSDRFPVTLPAPAVRSWSEGWSMFDDTLSDEILAHIRRDIEALDAAGYPARARAYNDALAAAFGPSERVVTAEIDLTAAEPEQRVIPDAETDTQPVQIVPEEHVRALIAGFGAMFTVHTSFALQEDGTYNIRDVVMGTPSGDRSLSFVYNPVRDLVSGIEQDGKILPYSLPLERYMAWVKGEK